ncbi:hypothetical protein ABT063_51595 [Streptomyces sp. NPDC002838]|uniref:hypothetical protein n=1 Tax=Streptomyces sp. NPDC002838 TaxID=3154436 RepID=UPI00332A84EB
MTPPPRREQPPRSEGSTPLPANAVRLRRLNRWQAETPREDLADPYVESSLARPGEEYVFAITEIVVHLHTKDQDQDQDLARRLQPRLLADHHASLGVTLVDQADSAAFDAFRSWGWQDIGAIRRPSTPAVPIGPTDEQRTVGPKAGADRVHGLQA